MADMQKFYNSLTESEKAELKSLIFAESGKKGGSVMSEAKLASNKAFTLFFNSGR
jgi:hypothetical protein